MFLAVALLASAATTRFICKLFLCSEEAHYFYMLLNVYVVLFLACVLI
jgi:hypothetical protein